MSTGKRPYRKKADILEDCRRVLAEKHSEVQQEAALKSLFAHGLRKRLEPLPFPEQAPRKSQRKELRIALCPNRLRPLSEKQADRLRKRGAEQRAKDNKRLATADELAKDRKRKTDPEYRERHRQRQSRRTAAEKRTQRAHVQRASANRRQETVHKGGTWQDAAARIAAAEGRSPDTGPKVMPPSYVGLNDQTSLRHIGQMYGFLNDVKWCTCVCCWRAWCHAPLGYTFDDVPSKTGQDHPWFQPSRSKILKCDQYTKSIDRWMLDCDEEKQGPYDEVRRQPLAALRYLEENYPAEICQQILERVADADRRRHIVLCKSCEPFVQDGQLQRPTRTRLCDYAVDPVRACADRVRERWHDHTEDESDEDAGDPRQSEYVLGRSVQDFAPAVAALSDGEEMVLALVHPLCQVYTIPRTGQLAYVGHVCNFRQKVTKFLSSLPTLPGNMPFVKVRPRSFGGRPGLKAPFTVDVAKLYRAFLWLKANNPYYRDVEWREDWAEEWRKEGVEIGTTRDEDMDDGQSLTVTRETFGLWMQQALRERESGADGFQMGGRVLALCESARDQSDDSADDWNRIRALVASALDSPLKRAASTVSRDDLAAMLYSHDAIDFDGLADLDAKAVCAAIGSWQPDQFPVELQRLHAEMSIVREDAAEDAPVESAGALSAPDITDDVGVRIAEVHGAAEAVRNTFDAGVDAGRGGPGAASPGGAFDQAPGSADGQREARSGKYPRVDAPEVEGAAATAIREDTPGYIARAFPKLFPHGVGDFHENQGGRTGPGSPHRLLNFNAWGRFVMTWHDGRFMRHSRFRYWLLDTALRSLTPSMQRVFLKTHASATNYTLEDLQDKAKCKDLVSQMSTSTSRLPGSVGERRQMRQNLEGMVNQIEAETADLGENGGAGRIPAGFCTLTCPVYKWEQLFEVVLRSYPSGSKGDSNCREYYEQWKSMTDAAEKHAAMRKALYQLSVANPACVEWYCALKLEVGVHLVKDVLTRQLRSDAVPGLTKTKQRICDSIKEKLGIDVDVDDLRIPDLLHFGYVDDFWLSFEWSAGGIMHAHIAFWIVGSPRIDKIDLPKEKSEDVIEVDASTEDCRVLAHEEAANQMAGFWDRLVTEFNVAKALQGHNEVVQKATNADRDVSAVDQGAAAAPAGDEARSLQGTLRDDSG